MFLSQLLFMFLGASHDDLIIEWEAFLFTIDIKVVPKCGIEQTSSRIDLNEPYFCKLQ